MNTIVETINAAGRGFVDFSLPMFVQSALLILILLAADTLLRRRIRAVFRYWVWMLVLVKLVLPPSLGSPVSVGTWFGDSLHVPTERVASVPPARAEDLRPLLFEGRPPATQQPSMPEAAIFLPTPEMPVEIELPVAPETDAIAHRPASELTWQGLALLIWSVVVAALTLLLLQRALFVQGLIGAAQDADPAMWSALEDCRRRLGLRRRIALRLSPNTASPAVCGLFRPVILIPQGLIPRLQPHDLQAVLIHELAHVKRGDLWANLIQTLLQIAYFYNPFLWLANAMIRRTREQAVDETVLVAMGEEARQYPQTLVNVARLAFTRRPVLSLRLIGVVESKGALTARIRHILNRPLPKSARLGLAGLAAVVIIGAILLPMAKAERNPLYISGIDERLDVSDRSGHLTIRSLHMAPPDGKRMPGGNEAVLSVRVENTSPEETYLGLYYYAKSGTIAGVFSPGSSATTRILPVPANWQGTLTYPIRYAPFVRDGRIQIRLAKCRDTQVHHERSVAFLPLDAEILHEKVYPIVTEEEPAINEPAEGSSAEGGPLDIQLIAVRPDAGSRYYDPTGKKLDWNPGFLRTLAYWGHDQYIRDFVLQMPDTNEHVLFDKWHEVHPVDSGRRYKRNNPPVGMGPYEGNQLYRWPLIFPRGYDVGTIARLIPRYRSVHQVDLTLRYFYGPPREPTHTFVGPFAAGETFPAGEDASCTVTCREEARDTFRFTFSPNLSIDSDTTILLYDADGGRRFPQYVHRDKDSWSFPWDGSLDRLAGITIGEQPYERVFRDVVVRYPDDPSRAYAPYVDRMVEVIDLQEHPKERIDSYEFKTPDEALAVIDLIQSALLIDKALEVFTSAYWIESPEAAARDKLRSVAHKWTDSLDVQMRLKGVRLGLLARSAEFFDQAVTVLEDDYHYLPEGGTAFEDRRNIAMLLRHHWQDRLSPPQREDIEAYFTAWHSGPIFRRTSKGIGGGALVEPATKAYVLDSEQLLMRERMPLPTLAAHTYYKVGETVWITFQGRYSTWRPTLEEVDRDPAGTPFVMWINGTECAAGFGVGPFAGVSAYLKLPYSYMRRYADSHLPVGRYTVAYGWKDVDVVDPDAPDNPVHFDRLLTDPVEFEIVEEIPADYYRPVYQEGWEDILRRGIETPFTDDPRRLGIAGSLLALRIAPLPFDLAFEVYAQAEGRQERHYVRQVAVKAGPSMYITDCSRNVDGLDWDTVGDKRWRLILVPSEKVATANPPIHEFYGREFVTDWLSFERSPQFEQRRQRDLERRKATSIPSEGPADSGSSAGQATEARISGRVLDPNGAPVAGAQVAWIDAARSVSITDGRLMEPRFGGREKGPIIETDEPGHFRFEEEPDDAFTLLAAHEAGFALVRSEQFAMDRVIRLQRWGRIEGQVARGREPLGGKIWMSGLPNSSWFEHRRDYHYETHCDAQGRFTFKRVPPGWFEAGYLTKIGDWASSLTSRTPVLVSSGETAKVRLGGEGRPVIGRFVPPEGYTEPIHFGQGLRSLGTVRPDPPRPADYDQMTSRQQGEWYQQWRKTPGFQTWSDAIWQDPNRRQYVFRIEADGSFRIEDVIPGKYDLMVSVEERPTGQGRDEEIGGYSGEIEVPPMDAAYSDEPLDVGDLVLSMREPPLKAGAPAPLFVAQTLDGKEIRLADYRGRFVLLSFWSPVYHPELDRLKDCYQDYGVTGELQIIGLGGNDTLAEVTKFVGEHDMEWPQIYWGREGYTSLWQSRSDETSLDRASWPSLG